MTEPGPLLPKDYTPRHLAEQILTSRGMIEGERKQVTVLFADIKGSLDLIRGTDPEDARTILDQALRRMMEAVHRYQGTVNKVLGDGIMALFGAPLAYEDHAVRACYAGLAMQDAMARSAEALRRNYGVEVQVRVGLNSGEVVVRAIGNDLTMDYDAIGETTHLAGRMEQLALPGTIRLTGDTLRLAEGFVQVKPLGPVAIKGLAAPIEVFELTGATPTRSRFQAALARGLTRFVGRDSELSALGRALDRAGEGQGQIVAVVGEPGVGKSRLFYEFAHSDKTADWLILESGSVSYGRASPYLPLIDLLKTYLRIDDRDDGRAMREKVTGKLLTLDEALRPVLPPILALLDVPVEDPAWESFDPAQRRRRTLEAVKTLLLRESQVQPVILVFEDLHWIDSETQGFLDSLAEGLPAAHILLLVNYRPEYRHEWSSRTYYMQLRIDPLAQESAEELLAALLGDDPGLASVRRMLIERTEGNPFFVEESVRTLVEAKTLEGAPGAYRLCGVPAAVEVPATVQGVLAARIDRLTGDDKRLLQTAAAVGKDIPYDLLEAVADLSPEALDRGLSVLQGAEFIYEMRLIPDREYTFKHALTHEVAYGSLLAERRRPLHARIAEATERLYADRLAERAERLAHHYTEAGEADKAIGYWQQAGQWAIEHSAHADAVAAFEKGLGLLEGLSKSPERGRRELDLLLGLGVPLQTIKGVTASVVGQTYDRARDLAEETGDAARLFTALWGLWKFERSLSNLVRARDLAQELVRLGQNRNDDDQLLQGHHAQWTTQLFLGDLISALEHCEQGIALYRPEHRRQADLFGGHAPYGCALAVSGMALWALGSPDQGLERLLRGLDFARKLDHVGSMANAFYVLSQVLLLRGEQRQLAEVTEEYSMLAEEHELEDDLAVARFVKGWLVARQGEEADGIALMREALAIRREMGRHTEETWFVAQLIDTLGRSDAVEEALELVGRAFADIDATEMRYWESELYRFKGELLLKRATAHVEAAEGCLENALGAARHRQARSLELRAATSLARLWEGQRRLNDARNLLAPIYGWFSEGFDTADLKEARVLLDELG
ncbi:MAG: adenylate/guanylate cyclase domain-containing protein [Alphaproteobacteria bacterium]